MKLVKENKTDRPLTVRELIAKLKKMGPDESVYSAGCDCIGECIGEVRDVVNERGGVMLTRRKESKE